MYVIYTVKPIIEFLKKKLCAIASVAASHLYHTTKRQIQWNLSIKDDQPPAQCVDTTGAPICNEYHYRKQTREPHPLDMQWISLQKTNEGTGPSRFVEYVITTQPQLDCSVCLSVLCRRQAPPPPLSFVPVVEVKIQPALHTHLPPPQHRHTAHTHTSQLHCSCEHKNTNRKHLQTHIKAHTGRRDINASAWSRRKTSRSSTMQRAIPGGDSIGFQCVLSFSTLELALTIHGLMKLGVAPVICPRQCCEDWKSGSHTADKWSAHRVHFVFEVVVRRLMRLE